MKDMLKVAVVPGATEPPLLMDAHGGNAQERGLAESGTAPRLSVSSIFKVNPLSVGDQVVVPVFCSVHVLVKVCPGAITMLAGIVAETKLAPSPAPAGKTGARKSKAEQAEIRTTWLIFMFSFLLRHSVSPRKEALTHDEQARIGKQRKRRKKLQSAGRATEIQTSALMQINRLFAPIQAS